MKACLSKRLSQTLYRTWQTTSPPRRRSDGARRSQPTSALFLTRPARDPRLRPALVTELGEQLLGALLGAVGLPLRVLAAPQAPRPHVGHESRAVQLGQEGQEVVLRPGEAQRQEAVALEAGGGPRAAPRAPVFPPGC